MKKLIIISLFLLSFTSYSQWISNFGGNPGRDINFENARGNAITADNLGYSYVTGYSVENETGNDILTIKYDPDGVIIWAMSFDGTAHLDDEGNGVCVDSYGNIYVVGTAQNTERSYDLTLLKYNSSGDLQWSQTYNNLGTGSPFEDKGLDIAADNNGNIYVTGYYTNGDTIKEIVTLKYSPNGTKIWEELEDGSDNLSSEGSSIAVSGSGNVYVAGYVTTESNGTDIAVIKYNSSGSKEWMNTHNGTGDGEDKAWGIVSDMDDNVYVTGNSTGAGSNISCITLKYNSSGVEQWASVYDGEGTDKAWGMVVDDDDCVYITGQTAVENNINYLTVKYDNSGTEQWTATYNGTGNGTDVANAIGIVEINNNSRSIVVTGKSWGNDNNYDYATVRYNAITGAQTQVNRYSMSGNSEDVAMNMAISESNDVYITGYSEIIIEASHGASYVTTQMLDWGESSELTNNNNIPRNYELYQNYPNPFNPSANIKFDISKTAIVKLAIYDILGKEVAVLLNQQLNAGSYNITYSNHGLSSGVYFYRLTAGNFIGIKKMALVK